MRSLVVVVVGLACGCGGGHAAAIPDAPTDIDGGTFSLPPQAAVGDTIGASAQGAVELSWDGTATLAVWVSPAQRASAVVVDSTAHLIGTTTAFAQPGVVAVQALALDTQLAAGLVTSEPKYYVVPVGDLGVAAAPIALDVPYASCSFVVPDKLLCTTPDAHQVLGTIAPTTAAVTFGPPTAMTIPAGVHSAGAALLFTNAAGCSQLATVAADNTIGDAHLIGCPSASTVASSTIAIEPMPTNDGVFARVYVNSNVDTTHRECAFYALDASFAPSRTAGYLDEDCPQGLGYGAFQAYGITLAHRGGGGFTVFGIDGTISFASTPILGISNLLSVGIVGEGGGAMMAISDGARIQFALGPVGVPL